MWTLAQLRLHPVKSAGALVVEEAELGPRGLEHDRRWVVVGPDGVAVTQRDAPVMATVRPRLEGGRLVLSAPGVADVEVIADAAATRVQASVWGGAALGLPAVREANDWWSALLDRPLTMVHMDDAARREVRPPVAAGGTGSGEAAARDVYEVSFADELPLLVLSQASLDALNDRLDGPIGPERFRPNLVFEGMEPFEEDRWSRIGAEGWELALVKPAARCKVVTIDQESGAVHPRGEPLRTLAAFRRGHPRAAQGEERGAFLGMRAAPLVEAARLRVGDTVRGLVPA